MKLSKTLIASSVAAVMAAGVMAPAQAEVEVGASVGISNAYMWRGFELGSGTPVVSGDLSVSASGFFAGIWTSSGDTSAGTEYDLYAGYGGEVSDFSYGIQYVTYVYPTGGYKETDGTPGKFAEVILSLGYGPVSFDYHKNISDVSDKTVGEEVIPGYSFSKDYQYYKLSFEFGAFGAAIGMHDEADAAEASVTGNAMHIDFSYAYNDNLTFTLSAIGSSDEGKGSGFEEAKPFFNVAYTLPLGE